MKDEFNFTHLKIKIHALAGHTYMTFGHFFAGKKNEAELMSEEVKQQFDELLEFCDKFEKKIGNVE